MNKLINKVIERNYALILRLMDWIKSKRGSKILTGLFYGWLWLLIIYMIIKVIHDLYYGNQV